MLECAEKASKRKPRLVRASQVEMRRVDYLLVPEESLRVCVVLVEERIVLA
jgi:hypothetical protein